MTEPRAFVYVVVEREEIVPRPDAEPIEVYHIRYVASSHERASAWINQHWEQGKHFRITDMEIDSAF
jgi:hypothetical protein